MENRVDFELARKALEQPLVEDVADQSRMALGPGGVVDVAQVEREDVVAVQLRKAMDEAVSDLSARPGDKDGLFARHDISKLRG